MSDSDDEYGPLQSTWGSQQPATTESASWDSLKDPSAKLTNKGLGTGQLHRKGKNFKPIDEEAIIAQRLQKNSNSKKKKGSGNVRSNTHNGATPTAKKETHRKTSLPPSSPPSLHQQRGRKAASFSSAPTSPPMRPALTQTRRISRPANNVWSKPLVDTPFWESDLPDIPSHENTYPPSSFSSFQSSNPNNNNNINNINHKDTQQQQQQQKQLQQQQHSINDHKNNNTSTLLPPSNNNHNSNNSNNSSTGNTAAGEEWNPSKIKSNGGWGGVDIISTNGWSNHDSVEANNYNNNSRNPTNQNKTENNSGWNSANPTQNQQPQQGWGNAPTTANNNSKNNGRNNNINNGSGNSNRYNNNTQPPQPEPAIANNSWNNTGTSMSSPPLPPPPVSNNGWGAAAANNNKGGWGSNSSNVDKSTPSWLDSVPENPPERSQNGKIGGRFSNKSRKKYSDIPIEVPKPRNYDTSQPVSFPTAVAPPPPPDNEHLITIIVELSSTIKVQVEVRELDEPKQLAQKFVMEQNLNSPQVLQALVKLFTSQKEAALAKRRQRPVKKYPNHHNVMRKNSNYYNNDSSFEYPEYLPAVYNNAPSLTTPFTRRAYY